MQHLRETSMGYHANGSFVTMSAISFGLEKNILFPVKKYEPLTLAMAKAS
jgi:hypothetical protein